MFRLSAININKIRIHTRDGALQAHLQGHPEFSPRQVPQPDKVYTMMDRDGNTRQMTAQEIVDTSDKDHVTIHEVSWPRLQSRTDML